MLLNFLCYKQKGLQNLFSFMSVYVDTQFGWNIIDNRWA